MQLEIGAIESSNRAKGSEAVRSEADKNLGTGLFGVDEGTGEAAKWDSSPKLVLEASFFIDSWEPPYPVK